jgi:negative regulator of flagellin synthesis FlgM
MDIKKITTYINQEAPKPQESVHQIKELEKVAEGKETAIPRDRVELSGKYQEIAQVKKVMMQREDIRTERVDQLRNMLEKGTYEVKPEKIAEKMLQEMW